MSILIDADDRHRTSTAINPQPFSQTKDYVEVVRCKDCKRHTDEQPGMVYCPHIVGGWCDDDWFCKSGERRKDEHTD